jgi:hypothetical protein
MYIIPFLDFKSTRHLVDPELLEPCHRQRRREVGDQEIGLCKLREDMFWDRLFPLPFNCILGEVLFDKCPTRLLPSPVRFAVIWRWQAREIWWFGKWDYGAVCGRHRANNLSLLIENPGLTILSGSCVYVAETDFVPCPDKLNTSCWCSPEAPDRLMRSNCRSRPRQIHPRIVRGYHGWKITYLMYNFLGGDGIIQTHSLTMTKALK